MVLGTGQGGVRAEVRGLGEGGKMVVTVYVGGKAGGCVGVCRLC